MTNKEILTAELLRPSDIIIEETLINHISADRKVRNIYFKRPNGRKEHLLTIQETLDGRHCSHYSTRK